MCVVLSGKSSIAYQIMKRDDYGFKGRRKNLISEEAQKGVGADNPYDPEVIDNPEVKCFPVMELTEAEAAFDEIKEYESQEGYGYVWLEYRDKIRIMCLE